MNPRKQHLQTERTSFQDIFTVSRIFPKPKSNLRQSALVRGSSPRRRAFRLGESPQETLKSESLRLGESPQESLKSQVYSLRILPLNSAQFHQKKVAPRNSSQFNFRY